MLISGDLELMDVFSATQSYSWFEIKVTFKTKWDPESFACIF